MEEFLRVNILMGKYGILQKIKINHGFTLIGVAIGVTLFGLFSASAIIAYETSQMGKRDEVTLARLDKIETAISIYISKNARAPCAAPRNAVVNTAAYGVEVVCPSAGGPAIAGTERINGAASGAPGPYFVRVGAVPTRSLNISDDNMYDGWGNLFTYAVTQKLASSTAFYAAVDEVGTITIDDATVEQQTTEAMYVVVSHGPDGNGAYSPAGTQPSACVTANLDGENCDNTPLLTYRLEGDVDPATGATLANFYSLSTTNSRYDDYIRYRDKKGILFSVVKDYEFITLACIPPNTVAAPWGHGGLNPNAEGENCSSLSFSAGHDRGYGISLSGGGTGKSVFSTPVGGRIAKTTGEVLIRLTLPIRYDNSLARVGPNPAAGGITALEYASPAFKILPRDPDPKVILNPPVPTLRGWEQAIHAGVFAGPTLGTMVPIVIGDIINPVSWLVTGPVPPNFIEFPASLGATGSIVVKYPIVEGQPYHVRIDVFSGSPIQIRNVSGWAGSIQLEDYDAEGYVEFMELGAI